MSKKLSFVFFTFLLVLGISSTSFAAEPTLTDDNGQAGEQPNASYGDIPTGCPGIEPFPTVEQQIAELQQTRSISEADRNEAIAKLLDMGTQLKPKTKSTAWTGLPGTFYCYTQTQPAYCMPATAQAVIRYLTGSCDSQDVVARELQVTPTGGGDFSNMRPYLNRKQNAATYVARNSSVSMDIMKANFYSDITLYKCPSVLRIATTEREGWLYNTDGHALNMNAAREDWGAFQMADPVMKYLNSSNNPYYRLNASVIYNAVTNNTYCGYLY